MDIAVDQRRSTAAIIRDHLAKRQAGELEQDIEENYAEDVVMLGAFGDRLGHAGVRESAAQLRHDLGNDAAFAFHTLVVGEAFAYLEWSASDREGRQLTTGVDSFAVRDGRIVFQSVHYPPPEARGWA
jgi:hypothetical protein